MPAQQFAVEIKGKKIRCAYIDDSATADKAIHRLLNRSTPTLGFDIETGKKKKYRDDKQAGLDPYRSFPSLVQFYDGIDTCYMFDTKRINIKQLQPVFTNKRVIAHHAIFDCSHMTLAGITDIKIDCSLILYYMTRAAEFPNTFMEKESIEDEWETEEGDGQVLDWLSPGEWYASNLRAVSAKLLGVEVSKEHQNSNWTDRPLSKEQLIYAAADSWLTYECGKILAKKAKKLGLEKVYGLNRKSIQVVSDMTLHGVMLDEEAHWKKCKQWAKERDRLYIELIPTFGPRLNLNSSTQLAHWLEKNVPLTLQHMWPRSEKTGRMSTSGPTMDKFKNQLPFVGKLFEYRTVNKLLSTYGPSLLEKINPVTGRLHGRFTLGKTYTGRLSSVDPNLQNIPRSEDLRSIFIADTKNGMEFSRADYSQVELRVLSVFARDQAMLKAFMQGMDIHTLLASYITGRPMDKITAEDRRMAKAGNFGFVYGLQPKQFVEYARWNYKVAMTLEQGFKLHRMFFRLFHGVASWHNLQRHRCGELGYTSTHMGKRRALLPKQLFTIPVNHPIQGTSAEITITAQNAVARSLSHCKSSNLWMTCHDELVVEHRVEDRAEVHQILYNDMLGAAVKVLPNLPVTGLLEPTSGRNWSEAKG